jgi:hypothetical protein
MQQRELTGEQAANRAMLGTGQPANCSRPLIAGSKEADPFDGGKLTAPELLKARMETT